MGLAIVIDLSVQEKLDFEVKGSFFFPNDSLVKLRVVLVELSEVGVGVNLSSVLALDVAVVVPVPSFVVAEVPFTIAAVSVVPFLPVVVSVVPIESLLSSIAPITSVASVTAWTSLTEVLVIVLLRPRFAFFIVVISLYFVFII